MTCTSLCKRSLDGFVDIGASDSLKRNGLILRIHNRQILDVLQFFDGDTDLYPACPAIGKIVPTIWTFIDGVRSIWVKGLDQLPSPCPGEIRKIPFPLHMLIAVYCVEF